MDSNSELHSHIGDQTRETDLLRTSKNKLLGALQEKDETIEKLQQSFEQKLEAMAKNHADKLKELEETQIGSDSQHEEQMTAKDRALAELRKYQAAQLDAELQAKDMAISELQHGKDEFAASLAAVEAELRELKESKEEYTQLVSNLQQKIRTMAENATGQEKPLGLSLHSSASSQEKRHESGSHSPLNLGISDSRPHSIRSHHSTHADVPLRSVEEDEDLSTWARGVERARMLRDETLV